MMKFIRHSTKLLKTQEILTRDDGVSRVLLLSRGHSVIFSVAPQKQSIEFTMVKKNMRLNMLKKVIAGWNAAFGGRVRNHGMIKKRHLAILKISVEKARHCLPLLPVALNAPPSPSAY